LALVYLVIETKLRRYSSKGVAQYVHLSVTDIHK